jgi:hypothetical protein
MFNTAEKFVLAISGVIAIVAVLAGVNNQQKQIDQLAQDNAVLRNIIKTRANYCKELLADPVVKRIMSVEWKIKLHKEVQK